MAEDAVELMKDDVRKRYELLAEGNLVGFLTYQVSDGVVDLIHTEVPPAHGGKGYGGRLARYALEDVRDQGLHVRPTCPFVARYITSHPEFASLVVAG